LDFQNLRFDLLKCVLASEWARCCFAMLFCGVFSVAMADKLACFAVMVVMIIKYTYFIQKERNFLPYRTMKPQKITEVEIVLFESKGLLQCNTEEYTIRLVAQDRILKQVEKTFTHDGFED
jgi:hypothetical protein